MTESHVRNPRRQRRKTAHQLARQPVPMQMYLALKILGASGVTTTNDANFVGRMTVLFMLDKKPLSEAQAGKLAALIRHYGLKETLKEMWADRDNAEWFYPMRDEP